MGGLEIPIYGFDLSRAQLYHGKAEDPDSTVKLTDPSLEKGWIAMKLRDWEFVVQYCTPSERM